MDREPIIGEIPDLPEVWQGARVVQLSDWQVGLWLDNQDTVEDAVEATVEVDPALVVLTGDFIYGPEDDPKDDYAFLTRLGRKLEEAEIPTYAVLGNHDYGLYVDSPDVDEHRAREVREALREGGVEVLQNDAVALDPPNGEKGARPLYLVGIGSRLAGHAHPDRALAEVPDGAPRVAIMHHPDTFDEFPARTAPIALAGHTHGGQIRIPGLPRWSWITLGKHEEVHADGWIPNYGAAGNHLYVNRGIGMSMIPIRINCMPEMTVLTLRAGDGGRGTAGGPSHPVTRW